MFENIVFSVCALLVVFVSGFLIFNYRNRGSISPDSPALVSGSVPMARQSRRKAARLLKKARRKNRNISSLELIETVVRSKPPMWRSYYNSPVSKRRKYKPRQW